MARRHRIKIKTPVEIVKMRAAGHAASAVLVELSQALAPGRTTKEIDTLAAELMRKHDCKSTVIGYRGFTGQICISLNEEVVHGIGGPRIIQHGDIVKLDVTVTKGGWIGDNAATYAVGEVPPETKRLLMTTEEALYQSFQYAKAGLRLSELCGAIEDYVKSQGFSVVRDFVGHGIGRDLHEEPQVPNYRPQGKSPTLEPGMTIAIEPMVNAGVAGIKILSDGWTVVTMDKKASAHFEHTVLITDGEPELLTARPREATAEILGL
ncbi:MAG: type methionyl aminopeptidase [Akkermansiaceae bacterium]|nr:type methionyl aminopeptidase [Akkermansiaceae bacterium]